MNVTARLPLATPTQRPLAERDGPLVAVCGLAGGAGTTTLAVATAIDAAASTTGAVLLAESSPERVGVAAAVGMTSECCLLDLAAGARPAQPFVAAAGNLRAVACAPKPAPVASPEQVATTLEEARRAHAAVIVDCGPLSHQAAPVLAAATTTAWVMPATPGALTRARLLLESPLAPRRGGRELIVAVAVDDHSPVPTKDLRALAAMRCDHLVLVSHSRALSNGQGVPAALDAFRDALDRLVEGPV